MIASGASRYINCQVIQHSDMTRELTTRTPFRFANLPGNRTHVVSEGDSLWYLASVYFAPLPRSAGYWWAIADFQPEPITDPTIELEVGRVIYIPSSETLENRILRAR
jgi:hypothetical protein